MSHRAKTMHRLVRDGMLGPLIKVELHICENCLVEKITRTLLSKGIIAEKPLQLIHFDIYGPINLSSKHKALYFIIFIYDYSHFSYVYLISHKLEALDCFRLCLNMVENQLDRNVKFKKLCTEKRINRQLTNNRTSQ